MTGCVCHDETSDKFRFSVTGEDLNSGTGTGNGITSSSGGEMVTYNVQVREALIDHVGLANSVMKRNNYGIEKGVLNRY